MSAADELEIRGLVARYAETSQFLLLTETPKPMQSPGYDHLGFLLESRAEVEELLARCKKWQERDERVRIKEYEDLVQGDFTGNRVVGRLDGVVGDLLPEEE